MSGMDRSNIPSNDAARAAGFPLDGHPMPGEPPYTRGIHSDMYRSKLWTMRQYAGFSSAKETNRRFRMLLDQGQTGLSVAFDLPTQLGLDSDHPRSLGEVGKVGVPIDTIEDMRQMFDSIDLSKVSTSMTINAPATTLLAMYVAVGEEQGASRDSLRGTVQNDILKEYIARGLYIFPPEQSMRLTTDLLDWCVDNAPMWNTISISGYHMREAGCTAVEEVAMTLSNALQYTRSAIRAGLDVDDFAPRMSFFFSSHNDLMEEVAKFRAARSLWYELVQVEFQPANPRSSQLRFHTQTAGVTLTAQQPLNNAVRVAYQALSAVLGGTQSLHTNSFDEAIGLPTEESARIALRTQQIIAEETGVANTVDPLAGSYLVEEMTSRIISEARALIEEIDSQGGALECIKSGLQQRMIHDSAWKNLQEIESGEIGVVGVNSYLDGDEASIKTQKLDAGDVQDKIAALKEYRSNRDQNSVTTALERLEDACSRGENVMEPIIDSVRAGATIGEVNEVLRTIFGLWTSPSGV
jgi:methylmalonyl-CoA mutase N-terminal domain/subunit